jgi:hypothetical protein
MSHPFRHLHTISKHRRQVLKNAWHMGIFLFALHHDITKLSPKEFLPSAKYYKGTSSPVYEQRLHERYFSSIAQHHTRRNPHHWEYWVDFFNGYILIKTMPYKWACEYVCDVLAASKTYEGESFKPQHAYDYFKGKCGHYYMTEATKEFVTWCLYEYMDGGWERLKRKKTKAKYDQITSRLQDVEVVTSLRTDGEPPKVI